MNKLKFIAQMEPWIDREEEKEIIKVLRSGWITEADKTREFEKAIAEFVGSKYCTVVSNGTVSLFVALRALGIGKGDEVIVPDMTMVASANAVELTGAGPVFVDVEKDTLCLDLDEVEKKITKKTRAIMPVAFNGRFPDMDKLLKIAKKNRLFIVEDAAQALGSFYKNKHLGSIGEIGSFSFSTPKIITTGQGGALVTDDEKLYEKMVRIKDFGRFDRRTQDHHEIGYNFKFSDILAALGIVQMKKLDWRIKRKKEMYKLYFENLKDLKQIEFLKTNLTQTSPWFIDIFVPDPLRLKKFLAEKGIGSREFYPSIHTLRSYKGKKKFQVSLWASKHGLWLPSSTILKHSDIIRTCQTIREFYENN